MCALTYILCALWMLYISTYVVHKSIDVTFFQSDLHQERASNVTLLDMDPGESRTSACEASHYVVIDSNVALEQV